MGDAYAKNGYEERDQRHQEDQKVAPVLSSHTVVNDHTVEVEFTDTPATGEAMLRHSVLVDLAFIAESAGGVLGQET